MIIGLKASSAVLSTISYLAGITGVTFTTGISLIVFGTKNNLNDGNFKGRLNFSKIGESSTKTSTTCNPIRTTTVISSNTSNTKGVAIVY